MVHRRGVRVLLAVVLFVVAVMVLLAALGEATLTYYLPPVPGSTAPNAHTTLWGPGVGAAVLAGLAVGASVVGLVWNVRRVPPRRLWWIAGGAVGLGLVVTVLVGSLAQPTF